MPDRAARSQDAPAGTRVDPLDLPVLDEVPELGAALQAARRIDREVAVLIDGLMRLQDDEVAEHATGVALEQWLAIVAGRTHADRRMLLTTCDVLRRLPSLRGAFLFEASVTWSQLRSIVLQVCRLPHQLDDRIDHELARAIGDATGADPDVLPRTVAWTVASLEPDTDTSPVRAPDEFFAMQPRLDGTGGRVWGEFGGHGFAVLDAALHTARGDEAGQHANHDPATPHGAEDTHVVDGHRAATAGARRARRLVELLDHDCGTPTGTLRPTLLVRIALDDLLLPDRTPAALLTHLTGGRMWVDAATARRIADERGADLRTVVLDDTGQVVGVGRRTRAVPGWLRETTLAVHDTCTGPGCQAAARVCDTDHADPWYPTNTDGHGGRTDVDNLGPLCRHHNRTKEPSGWRATQTADGSRDWHHPRTGLATRTIPATRDAVRTATPSHARSPGDTTRPAHRLPAARSRASPSTDDDDDGSPF